MQTGTMWWKWWGTNIKLKDNDILGEVNIEKPMILNIVTKSLSSNNNLSEIYRSESQFIIL